MLRHRLLNMLLNARKVSNREIPYGYTQVEYLESTGTQYINTGYNSDTSTKAHFVFEKTGVNMGDTTSGRGTAYFGVNAPSGEIILGYNNGINYVRGNAGYTTYNPTIGDKNEVIVDYTKGATSLYINGECYGTGTSTTTNTYNTRMLMLFALYGYSASSIKTYCQYKLYSFKMYNGYIKVRDYVPCLDDKGVPCLYDKVSGETFYNQGTGDFRVGYTLLTAYTPTVPTGYTLVDYLQGTGTQFLDTEFTVTTDNQATVRMEVDGNFGSSGTYSNWRVDGSGYPYLITTIGLNGNGQLAYGNKTADVSTGYLETDPTGRHFYMTDYKRGVYQRDWETIKTWTPQTGGNSNNLFIFACKKSDSSKQVNAQKYSFKIFEDDFIKFYGVPCLDPEGTPCMYDLIGEKAIYNIGTGTFKYGDVIGGGKYRIVNAITSTGTQYINTGITSYKSTYKYVLNLKKNINTTTFVFAQNPSMGQGNLGMFTNDTGYSIQNKQRVSVKASSDSFHEITITNTYVQVDDTQTNLTNTSEFTISAPLYLFASQDDLSRKFRGSIAKFQIFDEDDNILLNYIPVVRVEDDAVGMYDTVTNTFFTNAGTGTFSYE